MLTTVPTLLRAKHKFLLNLHKRSSSDMEDDDTFVIANPLRHEQIEEPPDMLEYLKVSVDTVKPYLDGIKCISFEGCDIVKLSSTSGCVLQLFGDVNALHVRIKSIVASTGAVAESACR